MYLVRLVAHDHEPPPDAYIPISGGLFRDSSIHDLDSLRWVTGMEVEEVYATGSVRGFPIFARFDDVDTGAAILRLTDGTLGILGQTRHDPRGYDIRMEIDRIEGQHRGWVDGADPAAIRRGQRPQH